MKYFNKDWVEDNVLLYVANQIGMVALSDTAGYQWEGQIDSLWIDDQTIFMNVRFESKNFLRVSHDIIAVQVFDKKGTWMLQEQYDQPLHIIADEGAYREISLKIIEGGEIDG